MALSAHQFPHLARFIFSCAFHSTPKDQARIIFIQSALAFLFPLQIDHTIPYLCDCHPRTQWLQPETVREPTNNKERSEFIPLVSDCVTACKLQTMCVFTWESRHSSQSVQRGKAGTFVAPGFGAGASVRRGRGNRVVEGGVGNMQSHSFTFLWPSLGVTWWRRIAVGASNMAGPAARGELRWGVRVHRGAVVWAGMSCLRFPLRTRGRQERRASGRLQQAFSSLCALGEAREKRRGRKKKTRTDETSQWS